MFIDPSVNVKVYPITTLGINPKGLGSTKGKMYGVTPS